MLRREDMFVATYRFYDVSFSGSGSSMTFAPNGSNPTIVVDLPAQSIGEQAFTSEPVKNTLARATLSGNSRLAFVVSGSEPFTAAALMGWTSRVLRLTDTSGPSEIETSIEAPWGIAMAPPQGLLQGPRVFPNDVLNHEGVTGLWTAELGSHLGPVMFRNAPPPLLAVDYRRPFAGDDPFLLPIPRVQREKIFHATQNSDPVVLNRLVLSPLGAWVDLEGNWSGTVEGAEALTNWRQRSTMGRDQYVRIIEKGYLFPFAHRAVEIRITERKIAPDNRAYLFQRIFIVVKQPEIVYSDEVEERDEGRRWPFRKVRLTTLVTPDLSATRELVPYNATKKDATDDPYWVRDASGNDVRFGVVATDWDGQEVHFSVPLIFARVSKYPQNAPSSPSLSYEPSGWQKVIAYYNGLRDNTKVGKDQRQRSTVDLGGQKVALAPSDPGAVVAPSDAVGGTSYQTSKLVLKATNLFEGVDFLVRFELEDADSPAFRPELGTADIRIDQVETMLGSSTKATTVKLNEDYARNEVANPTGVFADVLNPVGVTFPADKSGGLATPNMSIVGLTRDLGPVGDIASLLGGGAKFDPTAYFPDVPTPDVVLPNLLGGLPLVKVLSTSGGIEHAPVAKTVTLFPGGDKTQLPEGFRTTFDWNPLLSDFGPFEQGSNAALVIHGEFLSTIGDGASKSEITGNLTDFSIALGPIAIAFDKLSFSSRNGHKPDVDVQVADVGFRGSLDFLNDFAELMQSAGAGGLAIDVDAHGVGATYSLAIPDMGVGVFAMKNLSLVAGLTIPFKGDDPAALTFDFGKKDDPFLLSISLFAGSGYFGIELTPQGVRSMAISLGFGASVAFNIPPVLYGSVTIQAGILFSLETTGTDADTELPIQISKLGGFLSVKGSAEVAKVVTVSISLYLTFEYVSGPGVNKIHAEGVLTIEVDVVLFSKTITKTVTYDFGDGTDPTLAQAWTNNDWLEYAAAFDPVLT